MYCSNCGTKNQDGAMFCSNCGNPLQQSAQAQQAPAQPQYQQNQYQQTPPQGQYQQEPYQQNQYQQGQYQQNQYQQNQYQQGQYQQDWQNQYQQPAVQPALPMKWHKFLIYFSLWANGIINAATGVATMSGLTYGEYKDSVYSYFPALQSVDIVFGIAIIAIGVFAIYTRFRLAGYKKNGPKMLTILYLVTIAVSILYTAAASVILGDASSFTSNFASLAFSIAMVFVNRAYYQNRASLFVND